MEGHNSDSIVGSTTFLSNVREFPFYTSVASRINPEIKILGYVA
jgi:hypothetical protein